MAPGAMSQNGEKKRALDIRAGLFDGCSGAGMLNLPDLS
jgi:hypothetical protein